MMQLLVVTYDLMIDIMKVKPNNFVFVLFWEWLLLALHLYVFLLQYILCLL